MGYMPYTVSVGAELSKLTSYCRDPKNLVKTLNDLRNDKLSLPQCLTNAKARDAVVKHFAVHWLGYDPTTMKPQPAFDPANPNTTGWWSEWYGDAEGVLRETMIRAVEVALGLDPGMGPAAATRCWPMMFTWTCGSPMLQGWVSWCNFDATNNNGDESGTGGVVNVIFSTPGNGQPLWATPQSPGAGATAPDYDVNPTQVTGPYGLLVIGEDDMDVRQPGSQVFKHVGNQAIPSPWPDFFHTYGDALVTVSPAEVEGGVLEAGNVFP